MTQQKESILIVDDDKNACRALACMLEKEGYEPVTARSGREALEKVYGRSFDVTLLDIVLPDMQGTELLAPLKKMHPNMAVIMVTGHASLESAVQTLTDGASAYIAKPWSRKNVLTVLKEVLEKQRLLAEKQRVEEQLRESERRYQLLSITDDLTGLLNRRHFYKVLEVEMSRTERRYGHSFSLVMLDLDGFKECNDKFGHINGDAILKSFAQTLKSEMRKVDMAFRYGGDEFAVILPQTDAAGARRIVDRVRSKWSQTPKMGYPAAEGFLGFSAGIAESPENARTVDDLILSADNALYRSKREGGGRSTLMSDIEELGRISWRRNRERS